jgi:integrase
MNAIPRGSVFQYGDKFAYSIRLDTTEQDQKQMKRGGFGSKTEATKALEAVRDLVKLAKTQRGRRQVGDLIFERTQRRGELPDPEEVVRKLGARINPAGPSMTVGEWLDRWVVASRDRRASTKELDRARIEHFLKPHLGTIQLDELRVEDIDELFDWFEERNAEIEAALAAGEPVPSHPKDPRTRPHTLSVGTQLQIFSTLRSALTVAFKRGYIPLNYCSQVEPPKLPHSERPVWDGEQVARFLDATRDDRLHAAFRVVLLGGLRRGEVCGLRWADVDRDTGRLHVRRQRIYLGGKIVETDLKTEKSDRVVRLDAETAEALRAHRRVQLQERLTAGAAYEDHGWVFADKLGAPLLPKALSYRFRQAVERVGLPVIRLHDGRHTHATLGLAAGVPVKVMSKRLGHSTTAITLDVYGHVLPEMDDEAAALIAARVARRSG